MSAGRRLYDRWSRHRGALDLLYAVVFLGREGRFRRRSVAALDLEAGDSVLELGCGPGNSLRRLRERVGERGRVVGLDYSRGMVERASARVREAGWGNVEVLRADAARPGVAPRSFDAAYAAMSLSAMPDPDAVLRAVRDCLRPGGRLAVLDARPFQRLPWRLANPVVVPLATRLTNWYPGNDLPAAMRAVFGAATVADAEGGAVYVARAER